MSKAKHTPGPWEVSGKLPYIVAIAAPPYKLDGTTIISRGNETGGQDWPAIDKSEREANARLIAAAPALLEACKWLLGQWLEYADQRYLTDDEKQHIEQANAAIERAE